jgi:hypothetical protein
MKIQIGRETRDEVVARASRPCDGLHLKRTGETPVPLRSGSSTFDSRRAFDFRLAFTLLEVMIAVAIFFSATFAILALVSQTLKSARMLSRNVPTPGMALAQISLTNKLEEGSDNGDFGDSYPGYDWSSETTLYASNGLYEVDVFVFNNGNLDSSASALLFRPDSVTGLGTRSVFR